MRRILGDAGDDDDGRTAVADHLDAGEGLAVRSGVGAGDAARRAALAFVPEPERLRGGLFCDDHLGLSPEGGRRDGLDETERKSEMLEGRHRGHNRLTNDQ